MLDKRSKYSGNLNIWAGIVFFVQGFYLPFLTGCVAFITESVGGTHGGIIKSLN